MLHIMKHIHEVIMNILQEPFQQRIVEEILDLPVPQVQEQIVAVVNFSAQVRISDCWVSRRWIITSLSVWKRSSKTCISSFQKMPAKMITYRFFSLEAFLSIR